HSARGTPGYIPNPEAKPRSADGTAWGTVWESRTPPNKYCTKGSGPVHHVPGPTPFSCPQSDDEPEQYAAEAPGAEDVRQPVVVAPDEPGADPQQRHPGQDPDGASAAGDQPHRQCEADRRRRRVSRREV